MKNEIETINLKKVTIKDKNKEREENISCKLKIIISILILLLIIFIFAFNKIKHHYNNILLDKNSIIKRATKNNLTIVNEKFNEKKPLMPLEKEYLYDKIFYEENNMDSIENVNKIGYNLLFFEHSLEKGLSHFELRPFGKRHINSIILLLKKQLNYENYEKHFSFLCGINSLREYTKVYQEHKWTDKKEYINVLNFLRNYKGINKMKTGAFILTKEELKKDYNIDYKKFIKSRHSTRNYKNMNLRKEDIKEAVEMAKFSPSACNRQFIKLHYYPSGKMKQNVINYSPGKSGIYLNGVNTFIITFDVNGLKTPGERNQGYFNAGLFSTNLVNAFHSLGIGTCFIQFSNSVKQEEELKKINNIPQNERIAVILYAGYYDEKSIFAVSPRKDFNEYYTEHN